MVVSGLSLCRDLSSNCLPVELRQLIASLMAVSPHPPRALFLNLKEASA
jgi:hypothetical protein